MGEHLTPAQRDELLAELTELEGPRRQEIVEGGDPNVVSVGSHVVIKDDSGSRLEVEISGLGGPGKTSPSSPLGLALIGRRVGETVDVAAPKSSWAATIVEIRAAAAGRRRRARQDLHDRDGHAIGGEGVLEIGVLDVVEAGSAVSTEDVGASSVEHERSDGGWLGHCPRQYRSPLDRDIPHLG